jgi:ferredoxin-NADP reductase
LPEREGRLASVVDHGGDTRSLFLRLPPGEGLAFRPGQFLSCLLPIGIRPYSIASDPEQPELLELCLNRVPDGAGSAHLLDLPTGGVVRFTGPWGTFTLDRAPAAETVFLADGTGLAPIRPMLHRALATATHPVQLLHAAAVSLWHDELQRLAAAHPRFTFVPLPPGTLAAEAERRFVAADGDRRRHFFVCGVGPLVPQLRDLLRGAGYERRAVQYEKW